MPPKCKGLDFNLITLKASQLKVSTMLIQEGIQEQPQNCGQLVSNALINASRLAMLKLELCINVSSVIWILFIIYTIDRHLMYCS